MALKNIAPTTLSLKVGKSKSLVKNIVDDGEDIKLSTLAKLAGALGVSVSELIEEGPPEERWLPNGTTYEAIMTVVGPYVSEARASPASLLVAARVFEGVITALSEAPEEEAPNVVRNAALAILQREKLDMLQQGRDTQSDKADTA